MKVINEIAPSIEIRIKNNNQDWFDREVADLIHVREKLFLKFHIKFHIKSKLHINEEIYKKIRSQFQKLIKKKKQNFYEINLKQKINKPKELWKTLKSVGLSSKAASASNICLKERNEIVFNDTKICSIFKSFFSNLVQNLVSKLPPPPNVFIGSKVTSYYDDIKFKDLNFEFSETSPEKILNILKDLNPSKAAGLDNLSGKFLKDGTDILARPISQLCNLSIKLDSFPRSCKIAKVKLLFKKGSKTDPQNYHSISLLPILSKIIERIIHDQTQEFLSKNKILYRFQSGFRKSYSPNTLVLYI